MPLSMQFGGQKGKFMRISQKMLAFMLLEDDWEYIEYDGSYTYTLEESYCLFFSDQIREFERQDVFDKWWSNKKDKVWFRKSCTKTMVKFDYKTIQIWPENEDYIKTDRFIDLVDVCRLLCQESPSQ